MKSGASKEEKRRLNGRLLYILWTILKEQNRHNFMGILLTHIEDLSLAFEDINMSDS
jgi:hypothetical protein